MCARACSGASSPILITNDDGVSSPGLLELKRALEGLGELLVVAPSREYSCIGKAITVGRPIKVEEVELADGTQAYVVDGTPADAVIIALDKLLKCRPRLLVSGINLGPNLGLDDALDSGTLGAAYEASLRGVPSIAISYCAPRKGAEDEVDVEGLREAAKVARAVVEEVLERGFPRGVDVISVNVPHGFRAGGAPIRATRLSAKPYRELHVESSDGYVTRGWELDVYPEDEEGVDVEAIRRGEVSITPIRLALSASPKKVERVVRGVLRRLSRGT